MSRIDIKSLDASLSTILKSRNRQIMLSQVRNYTQFADFLDGQESVQVVTPGKSFFNALLTPCGEGQNAFILDPRGKRPGVAVGENLLILFQTQRDAAISQAVVTGVFGPKLRIAAVDPRTNIRYKTRIRAHWSPVSKECWDNFNSSKWTIIRQLTAPDHPGAREPGAEWLVREFALEIGDEPIDTKRILNGSERPQTPGLLVDLSLGGFCMMCDNSGIMQSVRENLFLYIEIPIPHVNQDHLIGVFAVARHIRVWQEWAVIHSMFVEKLAPELLVL